jgi:protein-S-isoprenylcysteine O-methyltransferase Ste14
VEASLTPYVRIFLVMACFGIFHSLTARDAFQNAVKKRWKISNALFAIVRSALSLTLLILSLVCLFRFAGDTRKLFHPILGFPAILPTFAAFLLAGRALMQVARDNRLLQLFGIKEYPKVFFFGKAYNVCRHPMYAGWLIASWGILLSKPYLLTVFYNLLLTVYVIYESLQEEKKMVALFGERYVAYRNRVPFLLPYGFLKKS